MSANSDNKPPSIEILKKALSLSWLKRHTTLYKSSSLALTPTTTYVSGLFESRTHLLDITSEQAALALATASKDPHVTHVITLVDGSFLVNPLVIKILADHVRRTGTPLSYSVYDKHGTQLYALPDVLDTYYKPAIEPMEKLALWSPHKNILEYDASRPLPEQLRKAATKGMETHFSAGTNTLYGAAVLAENKIYYGGVYSSFDRRLNLHAEMVAALSAIMNGTRDITHVAIISDKFINHVPHLCGPCRQFFSEIQEKTKQPITIICFSFDGTTTFTQDLATYLPHTWHSGHAL